LSCSWVTGATIAWPDADLVSCLVSCARLGPASKQAAPSHAAHLTDDLFMVSRPDFLLTSTGP
jgi:hypothetical protein